MNMDLPCGQGTVHISAAEGRLAGGGFFLPWGSSVQSAAAVDPTAICHWPSHERLVAVAQSEKPNFYWLLERVVGRLEGGVAWVARRLAGLALRQGQLVEEEEAVAEVEVSVDSS